MPDPAPFRGLLRGGGRQPEHVAGKEAVQALSGGMDHQGSKADGSGTEGIRLSDLRAVYAEREAIIDERPALFLPGRRAGLCLPKSGDDVENS